MKDNNLRKALAEIGVFSEITKMDTDFLRSSYRMDEALKLVYRVDELSDKLNRLMDYLGLEEVTIEHTKIQKKKKK